MGIYLVSKTARLHNINLFIVGFLQMNTATNTIYKPFEFDKSIYTQHQIKTFILR